MKFPVETIKELEEEKVGEGFDGYKLIKNSEWTSEGKYEYHHVIFEFEGKFYIYNNSRSGSYFTEWYYQDDSENGIVECPEVEAKEKIIVEWVIKKT